MLQGEHSDPWDYDFPFDFDRAWVAWVGNGDLALITDVFSHELVETITDPEPAPDPDWVMNRNINGGNEIGDACNNTADWVNGLFLQAYWSQKHSACVIPFGTTAQFDVNELRLQGSWIQADLSPIISNSPPASPAVGNPFPFTGLDLVPRVVYRDIFNHIKELSLQGTWMQSDLTAHIGTAPPTPPAASDPSVYIPPDGVPRVLFRGGDNHIHELQVTGTSGGIHTDLFADSNPPDAASDPFGYVSPADGVLRVVYRGVDNDIHELKFLGRWIHTDLSLVATITGGPAFTIQPWVPAAVGNPFAYTVRDDIPRVLFRGTDNDIHELRLEKGSWIYADLSRIPSDTPPAAAGDPFAYMTPDGVARVIYRSGGHIQELRLQGTWIHADLSSIAGLPSSSLFIFGMAAGNPYAYVTPNHIARVVYRGMEGHIHELSLQGTWTHADLSSIASGPYASGDPHAYVTPDGVARLVYR